MELVKGIEPSFLLQQNSLRKRVVTEKVGDPGMVAMFGKNLSQFPEPQGGNSDAHERGGFGKTKFQLQPTLAQVFTDGFWPVEGSFGLCKSQNRRGVQTFANSGKINTAERLCCSTLNISKNQRI